VKLGFSLSAFFICRAIEIRLLWERVTPVTLGMSFTRRLFNSNNFVGCLSGGMRSTECHSVL